MNLAAFPAPPAIDPAATKLSPRLVLKIGIGVLVGAAFGYAFGRAMALLESPAELGLADRIDANWITVALLPLTWLIVVLVHEFGHLLGGRVAGMRPLMLFAGPLHFEFGADRVRLRMNKVAATFGGLAACSPSPGTTRGGLALLVAGGPLSSVLLAAVALPGGLALGGWWGGFMFCTGALSLLIGMITLFPVRAGGFMSDGGQLLGLARGDPETRARLALSSLIAQSAAGTRPRDWNVALLAAVDSGSDEPALRAVTMALRAAHAEDRGDFDGAEASLRALAEHLAGAAGAAMPAAARRGLGLPIAGWIAIQQRDAALARAWFESARGGFAEQASIAYTQAAVLAAEGDLPGARAALASARAALPSLRDRGGALALSDALDRLAVRLDTQAPTSGHALPA